MSQFKYWLEIKRATRKADGLYIEGEASNTSLDAYETVFTEDCQRGFVTDIQEALEAGRPLQIEIEHDGDKAPIFNLGTIIDAELDVNRTKITAKLDESNPLAAYYHNILTSTPEENRANGRPETLGFSVKGAVQESHRAYNESAQKFITHFDRVKLRKVGLTDRPVNDECYAEAIKRSLNNNEEEVQMPELNPDVAAEVSTDVATEVVTEVVEEVSVEAVVEGENNGEQETQETGTETSDSSAEQEQEEGQEVNEVASVEVEAANLDVDEDSTQETVVEVEADRAKEVEVTDEVIVQRGVIADVQNMKEVSEEIRELTWTFQDLMFSAIYSSNPVEGAQRAKELATEYADLISQIGVGTERSLDSSDVALQKQDLDEKVTIKYALERRAKSASVAIDSIQRSHDEKTFSELVEIKRSLDELKQSMTDVKADNDKLKLDNEGLVQRNIELSKEPASNPASLLVEKRNSNREKIDELKRSKNKAEVAAFYLANLK